MKKTFFAVTLVGTLGLGATGHTEGRNIVTVVGKEVDIGEGGPATAVALNTPRGIGIDPQNNIYIAEFGSNRIRKVDAVSHVLTTVTGNGVASATGDFGPASLATINGPRDVNVDAAGNIYVSEFTGNRVRKVDATTKIITTIAGNGTPGFSGDTGLATSAQINTPRTVLADTSGNVYIADSGNGRVRKVTGGTITTYVGNGTSGLDDIPVGDAGLVSAIGLAFDGAENLYISGGGRVRKVDRLTLRITTVAGAAAAGVASRATTAPLNGAGQPAFDGAGNMWIPETNGNLIRKVTTGGNLVIDGLVQQSPSGECPADASVWEVVTVSGHLYCRDTGENMTTVAGDGVPIDTGDDVPGGASSAQVTNPTVVVFDTSGNLYMAVFARVRQISTSNTITTYAGGGAFVTGDGGPAVAAQLNLPFGVAIDSAGNRYVGEVSGSRVRRVDPAGTILTAAGSGTVGFTGDVVPALANISAGFGVATDAAGTLFIADAQNNRVRKVSGATMRTVAGNGIASTTGDKFAAVLAGVNQPQGAAFDDYGNLFIATTGQSRVRKVTPGINGVIDGVVPRTPSGDCSGYTYTTLQVTLGTATAPTFWCADPGEIITTVAGSGTATSFGDGGPATSGALGGPRGMAFDSDGNLYIANQNNAVRKVAAGANGIIDGLVAPPCVAPTSVAVGTAFCLDPEEIITRFAGSFVDGQYVAGYNGDNIAAASAQLNGAFGVAIDSEENLYIVEMAGNRVRKVDTDGNITTVAGNGIAGLTHDGGSATSANLNAPRAIAVDRADNLYITDGASNRVRRLNVAVGVTVNPDTLNGITHSNGPWVTAYIQLPAGRDAADINVDSVELQAIDPANGAVRVSGSQVLAVRRAPGSPVTRVDTDGNGVTDQLVLKFPRGTVALWAAGALRLEGQFYPPDGFPIGTYFSGDTPVRTAP